MLYFVKFTFPFTGVIRIPAGGQEPRGGSIIVEAEDVEAAKDQAMFEIYQRHGVGVMTQRVITGTVMSTSLIPRIVEVSEYID